MLAYHSDKSLKAQTVKAMVADIKAERLQPGHYWNGRNGCFVGCVIRGSEHGKFEDVLGIPRILARLGDHLYEALATTAEKQKFAVDFLQSIPVGTDLTAIWPQFALFLLLDKEHGVINFTKKENVKKAIQTVGDLYQRVVNGEVISVDLWRTARSNADAAAYADAYAAYAAAAAAYAAAYAAAADAYAAYAAAYAAAAYADAYAAYDAYAAAAARGRHAAALVAKLLALFGAAKKAVKISSKKKGK